MATAHRDLAVAVGLAAVLAAVLAVRVGVHVVGRT
jgi:hypothetical protein